MKLVGIFNNITLNDPNSLSKAKATKSNSGIKTLKIETGIIMYVNKGYKKALYTGDNIFNSN